MSAGKYSALVAPTDAPDWCKGIDRYHRL